jgi:hypothetical protein
MEPPSSVPNPIRPIPDLIVVERLIEQRPNRSVGVDELIRMTRTVIVKAVHRWVPYGDVALNQDGGGEEGEKEGRKKGRGDRESAQGGRGGKRHGCRG